MQRLDGEFNVIGVGDFVVRVHEHDVIAGGVAQGEALAFLHVFAVVIEDERAVFLGDVAGAVGGLRVGQNDFVAVTRPGLARDGGEGVVEQRAGVERRHDEADARPLEIFRIGRHGWIVSQTRSEFKPALRGGLDFAAAHGDEPDDENHRKRAAGREGQDAQQIRR